MSQTSDDAEQDFLDRSFFESDEAFENYLETGAINE